ncbi:MAG: cytochrome C [Gemmatimonadales bacterium]
MITALAVAATLATGIGTSPAVRSAKPRADRVTAPAELTLLADRARRTPSFARQMKLSCSTCHVGGFPQLTRFGRLFKLNGYTLSGLPQIVEQLDTLATRSLELSPIPGLSMAAIVDVTSLNKPLPGAARTIADYPQQLSLFFGGEIAPKLGGLAQLTYSDVSGRLGIDNTDVRFANHTKFRDRDVLFGVTLHNNPTVQDVWNTVPAWNYPFVSPVLVPRPMATTLIEGGLAQAVLGLGAYALYDNLLYAEVSGYTSAPQGPRALGDSGATNTTRNVVPYWRIALQNRHGPGYLMIGAFGLSADLFPKGVGDASNHYDDVGVDAQGERELGKGTLILRASYIHEHQGLVASATSVPPVARNITNTLQSFRANAAYAPNRYYSVTLGYFGTTGSSDTRLYASAPATGSSTGSPNTEGAIGELTLSPWLNARIGLQYVAYQRFNGASRSYDVVSNGRAAQDNNTLLLYTWFAF